MTTLPNTTADALDWVLDAFGPNGENWIQHAYASTDDPKKRCLLGMIGRYVEKKLCVTDANIDMSYFLLRNTIAKPIENVLEEQYGITRSPRASNGCPLTKLTTWNDDPDREFSEVVAVIEKARASCDA